MAVVTQNCRMSGNPFPIDERDQAYYQKMGVPFPQLCPEERQLRRMSWRNERNLYHRKCDACQKQIISMYHADSPYTIYCNDCWWSDNWDEMSYGQDIDFSRPIFDQLHELRLKVPRLALFRKNSSNSDYTNHSENNKNCYLCVDSAECDHVFHSKWMINDRDCMDCYNAKDSELCFESQYQVGGYQNIYNFFSDFSTNCAFVYNCKSCKDCFMSSNLNQKQYCIRNQQVSKEEYEAFIQSIDFESHEVMEGLKYEYVEMMRQSPKRSLLIMCEDCTGECLYKCQNVYDSFDVISSQDSRYCHDAGDLKDCYDVYESAFECELQYDCHGCNRGKNLKFGHVSWDVNNSSYVDSCHNSHDLFACIGLRRKSHCILNKQYTPEEYEQLVAQLTEHMKQTGEWGEFPPTDHSPFTYNESIAQEYFPLSQEQALQRGYRWRNDDNDSSYHGPITTLPDRLSDTPENVTQSILQCEVSGKLYKIIPQELSLYRKLGVALPRRCPQQRYLDRMVLRKARRLYDGQCFQCQTAIRSVYAPDSGETVYCENCYLKTFY